MNKRYTVNLPESSSKAKIADFSMLLFYGKTSKKMNIPWKLLHSSCPARESLFPKTKPHSKNPLSMNFSSYASLSLKPRILPPSASHCSKTFSTRRIPILPTSLHSNQPLQPTALSVCFFSFFFFFSGLSKTSSLQQLLHSLYFLSNSQKTAH